VAEAALRVHMRPDSTRSHPSSKSARSFFHQPFHLRHRFFPAYEQGLRDNRVADVEFVDARQRAN